MERPVQFTINAETGRGILHEPGAPGERPVVVFLHGWAGSRIGPHRMFVHMARRLAAAGYPCLRFDFRGRGDSGGTTAEATIRSMVEDTVAALDWARTALPGREAILLGICSGCKVAIGTMATGAPVAGLALWSAEPMGPMRAQAGGSGKSAHALRTYARKLLRPETWRKLLTLRVNVRMVGKAVAGKEVAGRNEVKDETLWIEGLRRYRGSALLVHGANDPETRISKAGYAALFRDAAIRHEVHEVADAGHSFYSLAWEREVMDVTEQWIRRNFV